MTNFLPNWLIIKDAGIVYESFRIETNWVLWYFWLHELNPQYKSFEKRSMIWIPDTNLMKPGLPNKSTIRIFWMPYGFANLKRRIRTDSYLFKVRLCTKICEDSWGFFGFVKTGQIFWKSVYESNPQTESFENIKDSWSTIQNESGFVSYGTNRTFLESGLIDWSFINPIVYIW